MTIEPSSFTPSIDNHLKTLTKMNVREELAKLATSDYQGREGNYPRADVPDSISVNGNSVSADFKNTTETTARKWLKRYLEGKGFRIKGEVESFQDGDYQDDWVVAYATVDESR